MKQLNSPGVDVEVINESFYTPAAPGTVPMLFVATAQDKANASGTGTAQGTTKSTTGQVWTITSQRDLSDTFGTPQFYTDQNGNPVHGGELNEYGLQAAYSLLGVSSKVFVVRADVDLSQLTSSGTIPEGAPKSGTYWLDTSNTTYGINEWDATNKVFVAKTPIVIDDSTMDTLTSSGVPTSAAGAKGAYAVVATSDNMAPIYYRNSDGNWVLVGTNTDSNFGPGAGVSDSTFGLSDCWATSFPVVKGAAAPAGVVASNTLFINGHQVVLGTTSTQGIASSINSTVPAYGVGAKVNASTGVLELYADGQAAQGGSITLSGTALSSLGLTTGTFAGLALSVAPHTQIPKFAANGNPSGSAYIKTTAASRGASWVVKYYNGATASWGTIPAPVYGSTTKALKGLDPTGGGKGIAVGSLFVESDYDHGTGVDDSSPKRANFKILRRAAISPTTITGGRTTFTIPTSFTFTIAESTVGSDTLASSVTITINSGTQTASQIAGSIQGALPAGSNVSAKANTDGSISISHALGGDMTISGSLPNLALLGLTASTTNLYTGGDFDTYAYLASNWKPLVFEAKQSAPYTDPADGQLWYGSNLSEVDIMYHDGQGWKGYKNAFPGTNSTGPLISASTPTTQADGVSPLADGDIWVDTSDSELYGQSIYVYDGVKSLKWIKQDPSDQSSQNAWLFADARWATNGYDTQPATIASLLSSDFLDPDAPDPALYPEGTRLWNLRRSGFNVKKYVVNHFDIYANDGKNGRYANEPTDGSGGSTAYSPNRWITVSPNHADGSGSFGRKAQRGFVVAGLKAAMDTNIKARDTDTLVYNLIATPGYPELIQNMITLNGDRGYSAFVLGDTPFRLAPTGTALSNWGKNTALAADNGDEGAVSYDEYMGMFYPSGYTNDNTGNYIVVPPSHMMLRTIAISDQKSYQWFAPSGVNRGAITNASSVGYITKENEFKTVSLPQSLRDVLAETKINPLATLNGVGIVNFGNYTRARAASSLDRINVARLTAYLRRQLGILSSPYLFEPNDATTRKEIKYAVESLMLELVGQRAIYDFIVVCDESNNTAARIDRSELWLDVAIEPVKAVEFIYIPLRLLNTGAIAAGLA